MEKDTLPTLRGLNPDLDKIEIMAASYNPLELIERAGRNLLIKRRPLSFQFLIIY